MYKPVVLIGNGMRGEPEAIERLCSLNVPVLTTWMGADLVPEDSPVFCGRPGILGQRAANIIQQKATHLFCFGARLDGEQVAYDYDRFAPHARVVVYDIDRTELGKLPLAWTRLTVRPEPTFDGADPCWLAWCKALYARFRPELDGTEGRYVDPFALVCLLGEHSENTDVFAIGSSGNAPTSFYQAFRVKRGQRISNVSSIGAMGADIPMAVGAAIATARRTICYTGDGGFMQNVQELEVVKRLHLPIIFFVLSNNGYASIRTMQDARFNGRHVGCDPKSGLTLPRLEEVAGAFGLPYLQLWGRDLREFRRCFDCAPLIVEVMADPNWRQLPRVMASTVNGELRTDDMQDMTPKIEDLQELMEWDG